MKKQQPQKNRSHHQYLHHQEQRLKRFHELYAKYKNNQSHIPEEVQWKFNFIAARILKQKINFTKPQQIQEIADLQDLPPKALIVIFNSLAKTFFQQGHIAISKDVERQGNNQNQSKQKKQVGFKKNSEINDLQIIQTVHSEQLTESLPQQIVLKCKIRFPGIFSQFWKQGQMKIQTSKNSILVGKTGKAIRVNLTVKENKNNSMGKLILQTQIQLNKIDDRTVAIIQDKKEVKIWVKFKNVDDCDRFIKIYKVLYLRLIKQHESLLVEKRRNQKSSPKKIMGLSLNFGTANNQEQLTIQCPKLERLTISNIDNNKNTQQKLQSKIKKIQSLPSKNKSKQVVYSPERKQRSARTCYSQQNREHVLTFQQDTMPMASCFQKDQNFQIVKYQKNCIIKMHKNSAQIRIQLQTGISDNIEQILSVMLNQKGWNSQIKSQKIINKLDTNIFLVKRVYKPYSKLSYERQTFSLVQFQKLNSRRGLLMEETVQDQIQSDNTQTLNIGNQSKTQRNNYKKKQKTIKADIKTVIFCEILQQNYSQHQKNSLGNNHNAKCKIIIESSFKGNGYCSVADNRGMLLQIFQNIIFFEDHYLITKMKNSPQRKTLVKIQQNSVSNKQANGKKTELKRQKYIHCSQNEEDSSDQQQDKSAFFKLKTMNIETNQNGQKRNSLQSYKSGPMSQSIATVKTDFTELTTRQLQMKRFHQLRPLWPLACLQQEYLQLLAKQLYQNLYLDVIKSVKQQAEQLSNEECNMSKKKTQSELIAVSEQEKLMISRNKQQKICLKGRFVVNQRKQTWDQSRPWYCLQGLLQKRGQYEISSDKELVMVNYHLIESQKATLTFVIKQIGVNLLSGKSVMNVSLPVDIFEPQSLLERSAASFGYAPHYLQPICQKDPLQQMKSIFAFLASIPTLQLNMMKPFNPILGETFQAYIKGIPIFYQQISHHPPISSYFMECKQFKLYGNLVAYADVGLNSAVGGNSGAMHIQLKNGSHFQCFFPPCQISGLIYGKRKFRAYGKGFIYERKSAIFCQFSIQKEKRGIYENEGHKKLKQADLIGGIFKVNQKFDKQFTQQSKQNIRKFDGLSKGHINQKLAKINGVWFETLYVNGEAIQKGKPYPLEYQYLALPSDCNFRLDIMYHRIKNQPRSQQQKQVLQNLQRTDRKLRQKYGKNRKKK